MGALSGLRRWLEQKVVDLRTRRTVILDIPVLVYNTRPDVDTAGALRRLEGALSLIRQYAPHHFRRLRRDFSGIRIQRYICRGAYIHTDRSCLVELTFVGSPRFSQAQVAATILHEAMHARLHRLGFPIQMEDRARQERFCRRAEIEFGAVVPSGEAIVERALASLSARDEDVAPVIDEALARERVVRADLEALPAPGWVKRAIARRQGLREGP